MIIDRGSGGERAIGLDQTCRPMGKLDRMNPTPPPLRCRIDREAGPPDFDDLAQFLAAVRDGLKRTHRRFHGRGGSPRFVASHLQSGSAIVDVRPEATQVAIDTLLRYTQTLRTIASGELPTGPLTGDDVRVYRRTADVLQSRTQTISIGDLTLAPDFVVHCDRLIENAPRSLGSLTGRLQGA